jgi:hypothetical protein
MIAKKIQASGHAIVPAGRKRSAAMAASQMDVWKKSRVSMIVNPTGCLETR